MALGAEREIRLQWDPKTLEIKTKSVEQALQPLVMKVTTLVNTDTGRKKGKSKRAHVLVALVEKAIENFIRNGEIITQENATSEVRRDLANAVEEVRLTGKSMTDTSREFADDPCSSQKRGNMVRASRALLSAVTRLLILADMIDVHLLLRSLRIVEGDLERLKNASNQDELRDGLEKLGKNTSNLLKEAARRQYELRDPQQRDDLAAARALLKKHSTMLMSASKVYLRHPELAAAKANRDFVLRQVCEAVNTISDIAQGTGRSDSGTQTIYGPGDLAAALNDLDRNIKIDPRDYNEKEVRPSLEEQLESIISGAALMADSSSTRDERRERIIGECNAVRQALQDLLSEYMSNAGRNDPTDNLNRATEHMNKKTRDLRRQLRKAVVDHVCDSFMEPNAPLNVLIEAAKGGNEPLVVQYSQVFSEHAKKLVEVANLSCTMSDNEDGVKMVRFASAQVDSLCPQVINAAKILASRPKSKPAMDNMEAFRKAWETQTTVLTEAVDDIVMIDDFLGVTENHILEDVNKCIAAVQEQDPECLERTAVSIQGRVGRVSDVVTSEMNVYVPGVYTEYVLGAVDELKKSVMPNFVSKVEIAVNALSASPPKEVDENEFIDASSRVYDGVREIRKAVLLSRDDDELDPDEVIIEEKTETESKLSGPAGSFGPDERSQRRAAMEKLPEKQKEKMVKETKDLKEQKRRLDKELTKWDDSGNDIIVLAKHMCMIMMEMTDFTWGKGPLKTTMDVINKAKKISELGSKLDKFARDIAEHCPEGSTKKDLLAYVNEIDLYCHQLNITSKVKADVQNISGDLVVAGLDSATSLIQAAKNLMTAVVSTVKTSYIASTKYPRQGGAHGQASKVVWKMKPPEKKPLVRREKPEEIRAIVRRSSHRSPNVIKELSNFQNHVDKV